MGEGERVVGDFADGLLISFAESAEIDGLDQRVAFSILISIHLMFK